MVENECSCKRQSIFFGNDSFSIEKLLDYYQNLTHIIDGPTPTYINKTPKKHKKLIILVKNENVFEAMYRIFPFAYYDVIGWECHGTYHSSKNEPLKNDLKIADKVLCVGGEDTLAGLPTSKCITYEKVNDPFLGNTYKFKFGKKNEGKKIIVWVPHLTNGIMWHIVHYIPSAIACSGYESFVDMQNYSSQYVDSSFLGTYNAWELFCKQLTTCTMDDIYDSSEVYFSYRSITSTTFDTTDYFSDLIISEVENKKTQLFSEKTDICGVYLRGTEFRRCPWHPIPYDGYEAAVVVKHYMEYYHLKYVFLNTEDQDNLETFKAIFKNKLVYLERDRARGFNLDHIVPLRFDGLQRGINYVVETLLTTKCSGVLTGPGAASELIVLLNKNKLFCERVLFKNREGLCGEKPLVVESHGKNHLNIVKHHEIIDGLTVICENQRVTIRGKTSNPVHIKLNTELYLQRAKTYCFSSTVEDSRIDYNLYLCNIHRFVGPNASINLKKCETHAIIDILLSPGYYNLSIGFQIEEGIFSSRFEPFHFSENDLAILDADGILYRFEYLERLNLTNGTFTINGKNRKIQYEELKRIRNMIQFEKGYLRIRHGDSYIDDLDSINAPIANKKLEDIVDYYLLFIPPDQGNVPAICAVANSFFHINNEVIQDNVVNRLKEISNYPPIAFLLSEFFKDPGYIHRDLKKSRTYLEYCISVKGIGQYIREYLDLLITIDSDESIDLAGKIIHNEKIADSKLLMLISEKLLANSRIEQSEEIANLAMKNDSTQVVSYVKLLIGDRTESSLNKAEKICLSSYADHYELAGILGKAYLDKDFEGNTSDALKYLSLAVEHGQLQYEDTLFGMLWKVNGADLVNYLGVLQKLSNEGNAKAMSWLGRAYRDGRGLSRDLDLAEHWFRESINNGFEWCRNLLYDLLLIRDTEVSLKESITILMPLINLEDKYACYRLGKAYELGKGVVKDCQKACNYYQISASKGLKDSQDALKRIKE